MVKTTLSTAVFSMQQTPQKQELNPRIFLPVRHSIYPETGAIMRRIAILICVAVLAAAMPAGKITAQTPKATPQAALPTKALLPEAFSGWVLDGKARSVSATAEADAANAAALTECSLSGAEIATYKREGETLTLRLLRFHDASGAFGAYSFYRQNGWPKEQIGSSATSNHNRVLFWLGTTVVDATFSHISTMSGSELRDLASQLPVPQGNKALLPPILANLPTDSLQKHTSHYAMGPAGYQSGGVLPAWLAGFEMGAEAVTADYALRSGPATLTILDYPTPQMAMAQENKIRAFLKAGKQASWTKALQDSNPSALEVHRSGPLVVVISGDAIPEESHKLLSMVHYEANLTDMPQSGESEVHKTSRLLMGIAGLVLVGSFAAILLGFFLGGGRALYRISRGKPVSSVYDEEFTRLNLDQK